MSQSSLPDITVIGRSPPPLGQDQLYQNMQQSFQMKLDLQSNDDSMMGRVQSQATNSKRYKLDDQQQQVQSV
jgi:hypothetical protein